MLPFPLLLAVTSQASLRARPSGGRSVLRSGTRGTGPGRQRKTGSCYMSRYHTSYCYHTSLVGLPHLLTTIPHIGTCNMRYGTCHLVRWGEVPYLPTVAGTATATVTAPVQSRTGSLPVSATVSLSRHCYCDGDSGYCNSCVLGDVSLYWAFAGSSEAEGANATAPVQSLSGPLPLPLSVSLSLSLLRHRGSDLATATPVSLGMCACAG